MRRAARLGRSLDLLSQQQRHISPTQTCTTKRAISTTRHQSAEDSPPRNTLLERLIWRKDKTSASSSSTEAYDERTVSPEKYKQLLSTYEPAKSMEGLTWVGEAEESQWETPTFQRFGPEEIVTGSEALEACVRRATIECLVLLEAGKLDTAALSLQGLALVDQVRLVAEEGGAALQAAQDVKSELVAVLLKRPEPQMPAFEEPTLSEEAVAADRSSFDPLQAEPEADPTPTRAEAAILADKSPVDPLAPGPGVSLPESRLWLSISLVDINLKFAVLKRVRQLTGQHISDARLSDINSPADILKTLIAPPKPRTVMEALAQRGDLRALPNVKIFERRVTPIDKERMVGRWKVVERELERRDLPVTGGHGVVDRRYARNKAFMI